MTHRLSGPGRLPSGRDSGPTPSCRIQLRVGLRTAVCESSSGPTWTIPAESVTLPALLLPARTSRSSCDDAVSGCGCRSSRLIVLVADLSDPERRLEVQGGGAQSGMRREHENGTPLWRGTVAASRHTVNPSSRGSDRSQISRTGAPRDWRIRDAATPSRTSTGSMAWLSTADGISPSAGSRTPR